MKLIYRVHAIQRMFQRNISEDAVEDCVNNGKIIEEYLDDEPYPSFLILGFEQKDFNKPLHVVFAKNGTENIIITVYRPEKSKWTDKYQTRIKK